MIDPVLFLPNGERFLSERLSFLILPTGSQVASRIIQQCCRFIEGDVPLSDEGFTGKRVREIPLTAGPGCWFIKGEDLLDRTHSTFCPVLLRLLVHLIQDHGLHQTMDTQGVGRGIAAEKRVVEQRCQRCIQPAPVGSNRVEDGSKMGCSLLNEFFGDGIGRQKGAEPHQFDRRRVISFDLLKRE
jgi:hypothetical protein